MSLLVVGAGGWVGTAVAAGAVAAGVDVHGLIRRPAPHLDDIVTQHAGDARRPNLGLEPDEAERLAKELTSIVVSVGAFDLSVGPAEAQSQHLAPLRGTLLFARSCPSLRNVVLVSSLLATGETRHRMRSDYDPATPRHRNFYEWVKLQGERVARASGLPVDIVRAGHVLAARSTSELPKKPQAVFELLRLLFAGWPLPVVGTNRYWCCPSDFAAAVVVDRSVNGTGGSSVWAVDPASPTLAEILDVINARYGVGGKRIRQHRLARTAGALIQPHWLDLPMRREVLDYCTAHWDLDLSCLDVLIDSGRVTPPANRAYLNRAITREVNRLRELP
jgi:nucleoside-diphosphate-sugar epimerase